MTTTDLHRCQACGSKHRHPKAHRALITLAQSFAIIAVQVVAALTLEGWLALAMWVVIARNVVFTTLVISGLAIAAAEQPEARR